MKTLICLIVISLSMQAAAQLSVFDTVNKKRYQIAQTGFIALGGWAVSNIGSGLISQKNTTGERKQFYRANTIGGLVDLAFAAVGYLSSRRMAGQPHDVLKTYKRQELAEKLFLFSVGLDLGAIAYGMYTKERANRFAGEKKEWLKGAGNALLLQGGFLFLFDGVMYLLHTRNGKRLQRTRENISFGVNEKGFGVFCRF